MTSDDLALVVVFVIIAVAVVLFRLIEAWEVRGSRDKDDKKQ